MVRGVRIMICQVILHQKKYVDDHVFGSDNLEDALNLKDKNITLPTEIKTGDTSIDLSKLAFYEE